MKNTFQYFIFVTLAFALTACQEEEKGGLPPISKDFRNMGGHGVERGLVKTSEDLLPGYMLLSVPNSATYYLVDREGQVVHEWNGIWGAMHAYLTDEGHIISSTFDPDAPRFYGGGANGRIQEFTWDDDFIWDFEYATDDYRLHHDISIMPNGHILAIAWEHKTKDEVLAKGREPKYTPEDGLWPDKIIEIDPTRPKGGDIVWEWHIWDHLIQDYDENLEGYGSPSDHPELLDINASAQEPDPMHPDTLAKVRRTRNINMNVTAGSDGCDVYHFNAIDYNPDLDQIAFSSPSLGEIFVIDHSTTTEEAAGHRGGRWGKGGDILYRWGNPENYGRGDSTNQRLFYQHDVKWVPKGYPGAGNLTVYNNNIPGPPPDSMNYSAVYELELPKVGPGEYNISEDGPIGPEEPVWKYIAEDTISFYSSYISGAHRMSNGNTFITCGAPGRTFEVSPEGEIVWDYWNPYRGKRTRLDGSTPNLGIRSNPWSHFRTTFIPADHPALEGKELVPLDPQPEPFELEIEHEEEEQ